MDRIWGEQDWTVEAVVTWAEDYNLDPIDHLHIFEAWQDSPDVQDASLVTYMTIHVFEPADVEYGDDEVIEDGLPYIRFTVPEVRWVDEAPPCIALSASRRADEELEACGCAGCPIGTKKAYGGGSAEHNYRA